MEKSGKKQVTNADLLKVSRWLTRVKKGKTGTRPPRAAIRSLFISMGTDPAVLKEVAVKKGLNSGTNKWQAPARKMILGVTAHTEYRQRAHAWAFGFVAAGGRIPKGKHSTYGLDHLMGWVLILGFNSGVSAKEILPYIEAAVQNFELWSVHKVPVEKRVKLLIWHAKDRTPMTVPVLPPQFIDYFIELLGIWLKRAQSSDRENEDTE